jgi:hypothetical protein
VNWIHAGTFGDFPQVKKSIEFFHGIKRQIRGTPAIEARAEYSRRMAAPGRIPSVSPPTNFSRLVTGTSLTHHITDTLTDRSAEFGIPDD